jgi:hypothetical protein
MAIIIMKTIIADGGGRVVFLTLLEFRVLMFRSCSKRGGISKFLCEVLLANTPPTKSPQMSVVPHALEFMYKKYSVGFITYN